MNEKTPRKYPDPETRRVKPGEKVITVRIPESYHRRWTSKRAALGLRSDDYILRLIDLEDQHPIE